MNDNPTVNKRIRVLHLLVNIFSVLLIGMSALWTYWGMGEMYHEGWWGAWTNRLPYLIPPAVTVLPTIAAILWPIIGGLLIIGVGVFAVVMFHNVVGLFGIAIALMGGVFLTFGILKRRNPVLFPILTGPWWRRHWRLAIAVVIPVVIAIGASAVMLPVVLTRQDDGIRTTRLIEGNGVSLTWAPEGPGWNDKQPWGGYPSWQDIALYGLEPVGMEDKPDYGRTATDIIFAGEEEMETSNICLYLDETGAELMTETQYIWRMPTTDELVRSLVHHGENAGCEWNGEVMKQVGCKLRPDKESPLWATDSPAIYYWTAEEYDEREGYFVAYNGTVNAAYKLGGNPRHSYRCVKEPLVDP